MTLIKCNVARAARVNNCSPENKMAASNLQFFLASFSKTTECKREEKYTASNRKGCGNPLGKILNSKLFTLYCFHRKIQLLYEFFFYFVPM